MQREENKADTHLVVGSIRVLGELSGGFVTEVKAEIDNIRNAALTARHDFNKYYLQAVLDGIITPQEKQVLRREMQIIESEFPLLNKAAVDLGMTEDNSSAYSVFIDSYRLLLDYLNEQLKLFDDMDKNTSIPSRADFIQKWTNYYEAVQELQIAMQKGIIDGSADVGTPDTLTGVSAAAVQDTILFRCVPPGIWRRSGAA